MSLDYQNLLDKALRNVVKEALIDVQFNGLDDKTRLKQIIEVSLSQLF